MNNNSEQRHIQQGLQTGDEINQAIAGIIVDKSVSMLKSALTEDFNSMLNAKLSSACSTVLNEHAAQSQKFAQQFLRQTKTKLAQRLVETQHSYPSQAIPSSISVEELENFDTSLDSEVARIADEAGAITIEVNPDSPIAF